MPDHKRIIEIRGKKKKKVRFLSDIRILAITEFDASLVQSRDTSSERSNKYSACNVSIDYCQTSLTETQTQGGTDAHRRTDRQTDRCILFGSDPMGSTTVYTHAVHSFPLSASVCWTMLPAYTENAI